MLGSPRQNGFSLLDNRSKMNRKGARDAELRVWGPDTHVRMKIVRSQKWLTVHRMSWLLGERAGFQGLWDGTITMAL